VFFQGLEKAGAEYPKPWNSRQGADQIQGRQRRQQQGGEEFEGVFHGCGLFFASSFAL
jgi:hypothetical protein